MKEMIDRLLEIKERNLRTYMRIGNLQKKISELSTSVYDLMMLKQLNYGD